MTDNKKGAEARVQNLIEEGAETVREVEAEAQHVVSEIEQRIAAVVDKWRSDHLTNNPFSRDSAAWNVLHEKLPHLVHAIVEEIG